MGEYNEFDTGWLSRIDPQPHVAGSMPAPAGWLEAERVVYDHELVLFEGGSFEVVIEGRNCPLRAPAYAIIPSGTRHSSWSTGKGSGYRRWVHFDWNAQGPPPRRLFTYLPGSARPQEFRRAPSHVPPGLLSGAVADMPRAAELHGRVAQLLAGDSAAVLRARPVLLDLLLTLLLPAAAPVEPPDPDLPARVRALLEREAQRPIRAMPLLSETLRATGYSYEHVCRVFREKYGIPPHAYIMGLRIEGAKRSLRSQRLPIAKVAAAAGFDSHAHFTRVFHRLTGMTPSAYAGRPGAGGTSNPRMRRRRKDD